MDSKLPDMGIVGCHGTKKKPQNHTGFIIETE
jgi:hypothetical protein